MFKRLVLICLAASSLLGAHELENFCDFATDLHKQGLLDGEILIASQDQMLIHLRSEGIGEAPQFMIGSVSKQFFAAALLNSLYDSGVEDVKRQLHLPLTHFLPEEAEIWSGNMPSWAHEVTLHHLLTHTSGIVNFTSVPNFKFWCESYHSPQEILKLIENEPLEFPPGSKFSYCNTGYVLIAEVIEAVTSLPASQYLQQTLFDPLGLTSTSNPPRGKWDALKQNQEYSRLLPPLVYDPTCDLFKTYPLQHPEDISMAKGAGSIISTAVDLHRWNLALHREKTVLPKELYELFLTPDKNGYAYGIGVDTIPAGLFYGHSGGIGSYSTHLLYMPERDLSIVLLSNIGLDFSKIQEEFMAIEGGLRETIFEEEERMEAAAQILFEKYPPARGFEVMMRRFWQALEEKSCQIS
jgi:CubicO group peptidase (beta-lactamase class C family)